MDHARGILCQFTYAFDRVEGVYEKLPIQVKILEAKSQTAKLTILVLTASMMPSAESTWTLPAIEAGTFAGSY